MVVKLGASSVIELVLQMTYFIKPTIFALKKIVYICEEYDDKFDIKFNGRTIKVIVCGMKGLGIIPEIYVKGELV